MPFLIDGLQYANWSPKIFRQMREGGVHGVHVTIAYHENFRETVANISAWHRRFEAFPDLIFHGRTAADIQTAQKTSRTAIFFGSQNPSCMEDDIGLIEVLHDLGLRFMQLSYNNQSLLACGYCEASDSGLTRMGREAVGEMNRVGMVIDMSHSADRSTLDAISRSSRPIAITHANPAFWHPAPRNKSDDILRALGESGGMLGFSLYPHHLKDGSACTLESFCEMVARTAEMIGIEHIGIGTDLCQDQPDSVVQWMRQGRWMKPSENDGGHSAADDSAVFPAMPDWFRDNRDFGNIATGLKALGMNAKEIEAVTGKNWLEFFERGFAPSGE